MLQKSEMWNYVLKNENLSKNQKDDANISRILSTNFIYSYSFLIEIYFTRNRMCVRRKIISIF